MHFGYTVRARMPRKNFPLARFSRLWHGAKADPLSGKCQAPPYFCAIRRLASNAAPHAQQVSFSTAPE
jgi:hypothetical protein